MPLTASAINAWAQASSPDYGLAVYAVTTDANHWKQFDSYNNINFGPTLSLTYANKLLPQIQVQSPPQGFQAGTLTPQLTAVGTIDPNLSTTIKYDFQVDDSSGTKVADSGLVTGGNWSVPSGALQWNQTYYWPCSPMTGPVTRPAPSGRP